MLSYRFLLTCLFASLVSLRSSPVQGQVIPDQTLGNEASSIISNVEVKDKPVDLIQGGAVRGANLFHSFQEFGIEENRGVYFSNPSGINNIFSRVTGDRLSNISGTLGVINADNATLGAADLFLINPQGIVFGQNAALDTNGSFVGTTANDLQFGDLGFFSATNPEVPLSLLKIDPSALLFAASTASPSQLLVQGDGQGARASAELIDTQTGLRVSGNQTLALIGGGLILNGATLKTAGGRIELGSVDSASVIGISPVAKGWDFDYSNVLNFQDIQFDLRAVADASGLGGGDIHLQGRQISLAGGSEIEASTLGSQPGGSLSITASDTVSLRNSEADRFYTGLYSLVYSEATGDGGDINIAANRFNVSGDAAIVSTATVGSGQGGDLTIRADDVEIVGDNLIGSPVSLQADTRSQTGGQGGNLTIDAQRLSVTRAQVSASTNGIGNAGNLTVRATESVTLAGENPGDESGSPGGLFAIVNNGATGRGGNLSVTTDRLSISDGSKAQSISLGNGNAGNTVINASRVAVFDTPLRNYYSTGIFAGTGTGPNNIELPSGSGGSLTIKANQVSVRGGEISADASGTGNAGSLLIQARDSVEVINNSAQTGSSSYITTDVNPGATGQGGDLTIETRNLLVLGSSISASTFGKGNAGNLTVRAGSIELSGEDLTVRNGIGSPGGLFAQVDVTGTGSGGNLVIEADRLQISDGSKVQAISFGNGNAGNVSITANEVDVFETDRPSFYTTGIFVGAGGDPTNFEVVQSGGGNLTINANRLSLRSAEISASTPGGGDAGNILLRVPGRLHLENSTIGTDSRSGSGGRIRIEGGVIVLRQDSDIQAFVDEGESSGGRMAIAADALLLLEDSDILAFSPDGQGGAIDLSQTTLFSQNLAPLSNRQQRTELLALDGNAQVDINATGGTQSGEISINNPNLVESELTGLSDTLVDTEALLANSCIARGAGRGGTLNISGRDRLPQKPNETIPTTYTAGTVQSIPAVTARLIMEPQAVYKLPDGRLVMSRDCTAHLSR